MAGVKIAAAQNGGSAEIAGPPDSSANTVLKLPGDTGSAGQVLKVKSANHSSTNAELEWAAAASNTPMFVAGPAVSATGLTSGQLTKVSFTEIHDPQSTYSNNSRFTPGVAGYYAFHTNVFMEDPNNNDVYNWELTLFKNGSTARATVGRFHSDNSDGDHLQPCFSGVIYLDADDYIEVYAMAGTYNSGNWNIDSTYGGMFTAYKLIGV